MPRSASCQAASDPESPPPITVTGGIEEDGVVIARVALPFWREVVESMGEESGDGEGGKGPSDPNTRGTQFLGWRAEGSEAVGHAGLDSADRGGDGGGNQTKDDG